MKSYLLDMNKVFIFKFTKKNNRTPSVTAMPIHSMKGGVKYLPNLVPMRIIEHQGRNALV